MDLNEVKKQQAARNVYDMSIRQDNQGFSLTGFIGGYNGPEFVVPITGQTMDDVYNELAAVGIISRGELAMMRAQSWARNTDCEKNDDQERSI